MLFGPHSYLLLAIIGVLVGALGTLVGAGGGFILVPILVFLMPEESAAQITAISMAMVSFNALSGTIAYGRMGRIDWQTGWRFALAAIPGAFIGAYTTKFIDRDIFDRIVGIFFVALAAFLIFRSIKVSGKEHSGRTKEKPVLSPKDQWVGGSLSAVVGFISSILGIGGGIIHVPGLIYLLGYPVHVATATSHFVLLCTSVVAVVEHIFQGSYAGHYGDSAALAIGAVFGAQIGARMSKRFGGTSIVLCLAAGLMFVAGRILWRSFS